MLDPEEVRVKLSGLAASTRRTIVEPPLGAVVAMCRRSWVRFSISSTNICPAFFCGTVAADGKTMVACLKSTARRGIEAKTAIHGSFIFRMGVS